MNLSEKAPAFVERVYSNGLGRFLARIISNIFGIFPFSFAEIILIILSVFIVFFILSSLYKVIFKKDKLLFIIKFILNIYIAASVIYFSFVILWGLNYNRLPLAQILNLDTAPSSVQELSLLCSDLIEKTNKIRNEVPLEKDGVFYIKDKNELFNSAHIGFDNLGKIYPVMKGHFGKPKQVMLSNPMCYAGITGVYFPFTSEANVNTYTPSPLLPSTICHEMAHQRGFAREDEANFIAYLASLEHPDVRFKYSGYLLALIHSMNAYYSYDRDGYRDLSAHYSDKVRNDLNFMNNFWKQYEGPVEKTSTAINDTYLKANNQDDGVNSYGRMVDLLIAEFKTKNKDKD